MPQRGPPTSHVASVGLAAAVAFVPGCGEIQPLSLTSSCVVTCAPDGIGYTSPKGRVTVALVALVVMIAVAPPVGVKYVPAVLNGPTMYPVPMKDRCRLLVPAALPRSKLVDGLR